MIAQLHGEILETQLDKDSLRAVLDVQGVGYDIHLMRACEGRLRSGQVLTLYISESVTAFDGSTTLYGFISREEKDFFVRLRENVEGMGPKKALECLDKISKSLPDFKRAILESDGRMLVSVFGFTKKTADKLIFSLREKVEGWAVSGPLKWGNVTEKPGEMEALSGLLNLGYREEEARELVQRARSSTGENASTEKILQEALRLMGSKI